MYNANSSPAPTAFAPTQCRLCPRGCGANRTTTPGACHGGSTPRVARAAPHLWEEPCLSGTRGSGTVFFGGCTLGCLFCQNRAISRGQGGRPLTVEQLAETFLSLQAQGAHNLNLVTATHYLPWVRAALRLAKSGGLRLPIVWNTGGYETQPVLTALGGFVHVFLADLKFYSPELSARLAGAPDYFEVAAAAAKRMCSLTGPPVYNKDGLLVRGTIVRLLVLPGARADAKQLLRWMAENLPPGGFLLSLMSQYTPPPGDADLPKPLTRHISTFEYNDVVDTAVALGLTTGYMQQRNSAKEEYTPPFDSTGVPTY